MLYKGALVDTTVEQWTGAENGNLHQLITRGRGERLLVDLNEFNHARQRLDDAAHFERVRRCTGTKLPLTSNYQTLPFILQTAHHDRLD